MVFKAGSKLCLKPAYDTGIGNVTGITGTFHLKIKQKGAISFFFCGFCSDFKPCCNVIGSRFMSNPVRALPAPVYIFLTRVVCFEEQCEGSNAVYLFLYGIPHQFLQIILDLDLIRKNDQKPLFKLSNMYVGPYQEDYAKRRGGGEGRRSSTCHHLQVPVLTTNCADRQCCRDVSRFVMQYSVNI